MYPTYSQKTKARKKYQRQTQEKSIKSNNPKKDEKQKILACQTQKNRKTKKFIKIYI